MTLKEIKELIRIVQNAKLSELSIEKDKFKIQIKTGSSGSMPVQVIAAPVVAPPAVSSTAPAATPASKAEQAAKDDAKFITIKSPMIGTFYRTPSPDKEPFINVGDTIKAGDVLCIIEAMKLFNEIESEVSGKVVKILVDNSTPVEYDQPLFLVDPKG
jgi:acetyl-CoA carboxylase biotin carboxyl carrier protein